LANTIIPHAEGAAVSTIALLARRKDISPSLFARYWRDVHGVLAARIPGFASYVQFHLGERLHEIEHALTSAPAATSPSIRFDGIAEVLFAQEQDRAGLASSPVAALIQQDERNVFQTSLLYNLAPGASGTHVNRLAPDGKPRPQHAEAAGAFLLIGRRSGRAGAGTVSVIEQTLLPALRAQAAVLKLRTHVLISGDPHWWSPDGVNHEQDPGNTFDVVVELVCPDQPSLRTCLDDVFADVGARLAPDIGNVQVYSIAAVYRMVDGGRPTHLGLRGLDVMQTIEAIGAENQKQDAVVNCIYGVAGAS
jgi:hypothetical protein